MKFIFNGTLDELKETIFIKANEHNKNIVVYDNNAGTLEIGFKRLGYSSGRFFVANIVTPENEAVILDGETKNIDSTTDTSKIGHFVSELVAFLLAYIFLAIILMIPWAFFKDYISIWIPLLLPVIYLCIPSFSDKKNEHKYDKEFTAFMSMFTTYTESNSDPISIQPCWDDVYKRLDLACGKLQSICNDDEDMLRITYDDGMLIDVGYVAEDKTYYITVVASDTAKGWKEPLGLVAVTDKSMLAPELQKAVYAFRNKTR